MAAEDASINCLIISVHLMFVLVTENPNNSSFPHVVMKELDWRLSVSLYFAEYCRKFTSLCDTEEED